MLSLLLLWGGFSSRVQAEKASARSVFTGPVVSVSDGDTLDVLVNNKARRIRLYGIDTPEKKQDFGAKAKQFASSLAFGKTVTVEVVSRDRRWKRDVGIVTLPDGRVLNHEMVRHGYAWWYAAYAPNDRTLKSLEEEARRKKLQVWSRPDAIAPWTFREKQRLDRRQKREQKAALSE